MKEHVLVMFRWPYVLSVKDMSFKSVSPRNNHHVCVCRECLVCNRVPLVHIYNLIIYIMFDNSFVEESPGKGVPTIISMAKPALPCTECTNCMW